MEESNSRLPQKIQPHSGSLHCRCNVTLVSSVCEAVLRSLFWVPRGLNELLKMNFKFISTLLANDNGCLNRPVMVQTQIVAQNTWFSLKILVVEKGATLQENILKEAPCLNKKMALGYGMLTGEFCIINREFSDLQCLMNTLRTKILVSLTV